MAAGVGFFAAEGVIRHGGWGGGQEVDDEVGESSNDVPVGVRRVESKIA